jgi:hypothetical protein
VFGVFEWSLANSLKLNPSKSMVLPIGDDFIPYVFKAKNLSVPFSYDLNWGDHVSTICRKVYGAVAEFRILADVILSLRLVFALFCTRFLFAKKTYIGVQCLCQVCLS